MDLEIKKEDNMKKILHIPNYFLPNHGGIEQVAYDIISGLGNEEYIHKVICFNNNKNTKTDIYLGIEVHRIGYWKKVASQAISFQYFFELKKIISEFNPDIIYFHMPNPLISLYLLLLKIRNRKLILHWHSDIVDQKTIKKFYLPFQNIMLNKANQIFVTSPDYKTGSEDLKGYLSKVDIIPNVIDKDKFILNPENLKNIEEIRLKYNNKKILFFLGRHIPYKGLEYLIDTADYIDKEAVILIGGQGSLTEKLKEQAKNKENIEFLGRITDEEVKEYLNSSYLFLFPSITKNEAFGVALAEALYNGIPAVGFAIEGSGVNWVNKNEYTGFMVENKNVKELAEKINLFLRNENLRRAMSINAKKWVAENFDKKLMIEKLKKCL